jgi:hypothetical protein
MNELLDNLVELVDSIREDAAKFDEKGNKAAGTRVRKAMQSIKATAQDVRTYVSEKNNA